MIFCKPVVHVVEVLVFQVGGVTPTRATVCKKNAFGVFLKLCVVSVAV